jgi:hypothetical protein
MPTKGYRQSAAHRQKIREKNLLRARIVKDALAHYTPPAHVRMRGTKPIHKPDPIATPVPPSASTIRSDLSQRWAVYSFNEDGKYYFKREQADSLADLQKAIRQQAIPYPLWTFVKSARTLEELGTLPIRIPLSAIPTLGHRFGPLKEKKKL